MRKTIVGCRALLGEGALPSSGAVDIVVEGRLIREIRPHRAAEPEGDVVPAQGLLVTAGLINGHHHSHEGFYKGRKDNLPLELWMNYVRPLRPLELTPRDVYLRTMIGAIEAVKSGTTTISDDINQSPRVRPDHVEQVFQAYTDIGIRANVGITLFDRPFFRAVPFVEEEFPKDLLARLDANKMYSADELLAFVTNLARTKHPKENRVGYIATPSAPQRCTEEFLLKVRRMADDHDLPLMIHVQETRMQVVTGQLWYGSTMIEYLDRIGFMKPKTAFIHGIWLNPREIQILARTGVSIQHNPTSNLKVGSGLAPIRALLDAGVNVSMGTDGCGSIEGTDMQNALYLAALLQKLRGDHTTWVGAAEAFHAATMGGAKALGRAKELGAVEAGRIADLVGYRLDGISFTPLNNPVNQLVYSAGRNEVDLVMVDGEVIEQGGKLTRIDEDAIIDEIHAAHERIEPMLTASEADVEELVVPYERIYRRCQCMDIAKDTYPARFSH
ncbi:MAG: 5-methylthioadenosine/S-adenosylhomocysteine deaminase [Alphaproteobacteria bacterium]|jgi:5-methylthioadenosine/S-adenosylhomocysteine deaminase|nr:5-methylthioadenosine/S-adenosylhomocysteine deaminase [Alphaproteobacteria bacterium]